MYSGLASFGSGYFPGANEIADGPTTTHPSASRRLSDSDLLLAIFRPTTRFLIRSNPPFPTTILRGPLHPWGERRSFAAGMGELDPDYSLVGVNEVDDPLESGYLGVLPQPLYYWSKLR